MDDGELVKQMDWTVDMAYLEDGPAAGQMVQIDAALPLHLLIGFGGMDRIVYKKVMFDKQFPSRNDAGCVVYRVSENQ